MELIVPKILSWRTEKMDKKDILIDVRNSSMGEALRNIAIALMAEKQLLDAWCEFNDETLSHKSREELECAYLCVHNVIEMYMDQNIREIEEYTRILDT